MRLLAMVCWGAMLAQTLSAQDMARVRRHIDTLCSPAMHGRGYVAQGDKIAAEWLRARFAEIGLQPFDGDYFQYFKIEVNTFPKQLALHVGKHRLRVGADFIVNSISRGGRGKGAILPLDSLIFTDSLYRAKLLATPLHHKVLLLSEKTRHRLIELPSPVIDHLYQAAALIELKPGKLTASISTRAFSPNIFEIPQAKWDSLLSNYKRLPRVRYRVDAQHKRNYLTHNVIGYVPGTVEPDSFLVVSAHYDHLGRMGRDTYFPGANDNASGTSMLLELADHFVKNPLPYSVIFIAFGAEEAGLLGSKHFVLYPKVPLEQIKLVFNLDIVGTGDEGATVVNGSIFKRDFARLTQINEANQYLPKLNARGFAANSDHYPFTENRVKAFFLYTLGGITAYHDIYDRAATLPLTRYKQVFALVRDFLSTTP